MIGLNDKTVVLAGPFGLLLQNLIARISENGADVAVITDDVKSCQRVCQNIMDMREVSEKFGRAAVVESALVKDESSANNAFSRSAEIFGGVDIYIDTHLWGMNIPFHTSANLGDIEGVFQSAFKKTQLMTDVAASYLKSRTRGRILYLFHELDVLSAEKAQAPIFKVFIEHLKQKSALLIGQHTTVNALSVGANEEYLISRFAKNLTIQKALQELQKTIPSAKLIDYNEISNFVTFLTSPSSSGLSGQVLHLNHGA
jgi:NAD(P)-dependent dehydrogenase (short-subunit alcohol dehydrogenase family)